MYLSWTDDVPIVYLPYTCASRWIARVRALRVGGEVLGLGEGQGRAPAGGRVGVEGGVAEQEPPSAASDRPQRQTANIKLARALNPGATHGNTLVMRSSAAQLPVLGPGGPAVRVGLVAQSRVAHVVLALDVGAQVASADGPVQRASRVQDDRRACDERLRETPYPALTGALP